MKKSSIPYVENFLTEEEADSLYDFCQQLPATRPVNPRNPKSFIRKVSYGCYSILPESRTGRTVHGGGAEGFAASPDEIKVLAAKLTAWAKVEVNYLSVLGYMNEKDHIGFHGHREDDTLKDQSVYVISLGEERLLTIRPVESKDRNTYEGLLPTHGSLYVLPHEYKGGVFNQTHEHAILDSKVPCGLRISINCKHIDDEYLLKPNRIYGVPPPPPTILCGQGGRHESGASEKAANIHQTQSMLICTQFLETTND